MDWVGIDQAVLLQGPLYGEANDLVAASVARWPHRFIGAAFVDPRSEDARDVLSACVDDHGFGIIKLELSEDAGLTGLYPDLRLDETGMVWLWREAEERDLVVTLDLGSIDTRSYQTDALRAVLGRHPDLRVVIAHLAHPPLDRPGDARSNALWREQLSLARDYRVWFDLAALPIYAPREDYPYRTAQDYVSQAVDLLGADRLMWGSDVPAMLGRATYRQLLDSVARHCTFLSSQELSMVLGETARQVYGVGSAPPG
jgi:predicted TIM-barrel fold metal-dependent hydrolase